LHTKNARTRLAALAGWVDRWAMGWGFVDAHTYTVYKYIHTPSHSRYDRQRDRHVKQIRFSVGGVYSSRKIHTCG